MNTKQKSLDSMFLIIVGLFLITYVYWCWDIFEPDFYHIANTGRDLLNDFSNLYYNNNFVLDGYATLIQQWIYCIIVYKVYDLFGMTGINVFVLLQFILLLSTLIKLSKILMNSNNLKTASLIALLSLISFRYFNIRPQMISMLLIISELIAIEKFKHTGKKKWLWILPLTVFIEINIHMTFWIFHFIVILPYVVKINKMNNVLNNRLFIIDDSIAFKNFIPYIFFMVLVLFFNPYGINGILCLFNSTGISILGFEELQPLKILEEGGCFINFTAVILVYLIKEGKITSSTFFMSIGFTLLSATMLRNYIFFTISLVYILSTCINLKNFTLELFEKRNKLLLIIISILLIYTPFKAVMCKEMAKDHTIPIEITNYLKKYDSNIKNKKVFTDINVSSYFLWDGVGKIYIESKTEPYIEKINKKKDIISEYDYVTKYATIEDINNFLDIYDFDYVCIPRGYVNLMNYFDNSKNYRCIYKTERDDPLEGKIVTYKLYEHQGGNEN